jgi:hypothetical protein
MKAIFELHSRSALASEAARPEPPLPSRAAAGAEAETAVPCWMAHRSAVCTYCSWCGFSIRNPFIGSQADLEALDKEERHLLDDAAAHGEEDADDDIYQIYMCGPPAFCFLHVCCLCMPCTAADALLGIEVVQVSLAACWTSACSESWLLSLLLLL